MPAVLRRLKAIQHPQSYAGKAGQLEVADPYPDNSNQDHDLDLTMYDSLQDHIVCTFARPAGSKPNLAIVEVAEPHKLAGAEIMLTLKESQYWIRQLKEGDIVHVKSRLKPATKADFLSDPCANAWQPLFDQYGKEQTLAPIQTIADLEAAHYSEGRDLPGTLRIDTYLSDPEHIAMLEKLTLHCSKKEAGHLLLKYAIKNLPAWTKQSAPSPIYDWLNNF